jgi:5-formyltetrahydrofolate cyclo-ligase
MLERRNRLNSKEIARRSKSIQEFVINSREFRLAKIVGAYFALGSEVTTELIIKHAKILGKKIALPRVEEDKITFYELSSTKSLIKRRFGIMEPPP